MVQIILLLVVIAQPLFFLLSRDLITEESLDDEQIQLLEGLHESPPESGNLVIIGHLEFIEWAPYITETTVLNVPYGTEFAPEKEWLFDFNETALLCETAACIQENIADHFADLPHTVIIDTAVYIAALAEDIRNMPREESVEIIGDRFVMYSNGP